MKLELLIFIFFNFIDRFNSYCNTIPVLRYRYGVVATVGNRFISTATYSVGEDLETVSRNNSISTNL